MKPRHLFVFAALFFCVFGPPLSTQLHATPLSQWRISCGVDKGSIKKTGKIWIFKTSSNKCSGGIFKQRAEIETDHIKPNHKGAYIFQSTISMRSAVAEKYDIFQMHDGRNGCAPPLKVTVLKSGRLELGSDYKTGPANPVFVANFQNPRQKGKSNATERNRNLRFW